MKNRKINTIIIVASFILLIGYLFLMDNPKNLLIAIKSAKPEYLLYAFFCILLYWLFETWALQSICHKLSNKVSMIACLKTTMVGQLFNCITPFSSGGQPVQAILLTQNKVPIGEASCVLLAKFIVYQTTLTFYSLFVIIFKLKFFMNHVSGFGFLVLIGFTINIIVVSFLIGIGFFPNITEKVLLKLISFLHKLKIVKNLEHTTIHIKEELSNFYQNFALLKKDLKLLILPTLITILQLTVFFLIPYFVCLSLGVSQVNVINVICAGAFVLMITSFVPLPGGSGGAEGSFYLFFKMFFSHASLLAIAIILWRIFTFYLPIIVGILFTKLNNDIPLSET